jgi:diketogulonate reductase-like aldo/keto reductase
LRETIEAFEALKDAGKILDWGVSNFDIGEMEELAGTTGGTACATNQILYNLTRRGIEFDLMPWCRALKMPVMAYSPIEQGRMLGHAALGDVARRHKATPAQVALAWLMRQGGVIVIPKATALTHVEEDIAALDLALTADDLTTLDRAFPPPKKATSLDML